jgi:hypothetical protein
MYANVAPTIAHKSARTPVAQAASPAAVYDAVTAQGRVAFAAMEAGGGQGAGEGLARDLGLDRDGVAPFQPCTATTNESRLAHQRSVRHDDKGCKHCVPKSPRQIPVTGATTCATPDPQCTPLSVDRQHQSPACYVDTPTI